MKSEQCIILPLHQSYPTPPSCDVTQVTAAVTLVCIKRVDCLYKTETTHKTQGHNPPDKSDVTHRGSCVLECAHKKVTLVLTKSWLINHLQCILMSDKGTCTWKMLRNLHISHQKKTFIFFFFFLSLQQLQTPQPYNNMALITVMPELHFSVG